MVKANLAVAGRPGFLVYNVGTGQETSVVELYHELERALGLVVEPRFGPAQSGEQLRSSIDSRRLRSDLGLGPPVSLAAGFRRTAEWFRRRRQVDRA